MSDKEQAWPFGSWDSYGTEQIEILELDEEGHRVTIRRWWHGGASHFEDSPALWTTKGVAEQVLVSVVRIRQLLAEGRFPSAYKMVGRWLIPDADVKAYLAYPDRRRKGKSLQGSLPGVQEDS